MTCTHPIAGSPCGMSAVYVDQSRGVSLCALHLARASAGSEPPPLDGPEARERNRSQLEWAMKRARERMTRHEPQGG